MFTPADTISIPTSRLKENIPDIAAITGNTLWGFSLLLSKTALNYAPTSILLSIALYHRIFTNEFNPSF